MIRAEQMNWRCLQVAEEAIAIMGEPNSLSTAWRVQKNLTELSYTQFW